MITTVSALVRNGRRGLGLFFPWWKKLFSVPASTRELGKEFQLAREKKQLSTAEVADRLHWHEEMILALENEGIEGSLNPTLYHPGYFRLAAITYARFLEIDLLQIQPLLPPLAPLRSRYTTFIGRLSPLQSKPQKTSFMRKEQQYVVCSLKSMKEVIIKSLKGLLVLILLLFFWNAVRYFMRVL